MSEKSAEHHLFSKPIKPSLQAHESFVQQTTDDICAEMKRQGVTESTLAEWMDMPEPKVKTLLNGKCSSLCALAEVCLVLGIRPRNSLLDGNEP